MEEERSRSDSRSDYVLRGEEVYRLLAESSQDFLYLVGADMRLLFVNRAGADYFHSSPEKLVGTPIRNLFPATAERQEANIRLVLATGQPLFSEYPYFLNGKEVWMNARLAPVRNEKGETIAVAGTSIDITHRVIADRASRQRSETLEMRVEERTRELFRSKMMLEQEIRERGFVETALRESEERFKKFFETIPLLASINTIEDERFVEVNAAFLNILGLARDEVIGRTMTELGLFEDEPIRVAGRKMLQEQGRVRNLEMRIKTRLGEYKYGLFNVDILQLHEKRYVFVTMEDITERKLLERRMLQTQKLESLGVMAGGIAHDINNLLVGVVGNAELALLDMPLESGARSKIDDIRTAANRLSELTNQMLAFAGKGKFLIKPIDITGAVREMFNLLSTGISKKIETRLELVEGLPAVMADTSQVRQVIMNLITNGAEAIGERTGTLTIRTGTTMVKEGARLESYFHDAVQPGLYVFFEVSDTGAGIDPPTMEHIFDPFFSTKVTGRGLGLAAVAGIVRDHGGVIQVSTALGEGSAFRVLLPCAIAACEEVGEDQSSQLTAPGASILVVDDDETVCGIAGSYLEKCGFSVVAARNGREAVEAVRRDGRIRAVLIDLIMPEMDGIEASLEIARINENLPIILTSGYPKQYAAERCEGLKIAGFIQKPYNFKELVSLLSTVLARPGTDTEQGV